MDQPIGRVVAPQPYALVEVQHRPGGPLGATRKFFMSSIRPGELAFQSTFGCYTIEGLRRDFGYALWQLLAPLCGESPNVTWGPSARLESQGRTGRALGPLA